MVTPTGFTSDSAQVMKLSKAAITSILQVITHGFFAFYCLEKPLIVIYFMVKEVAVVTDNELPVSKLPAYARLPPRRYVASHVQYPMML